MSELRKVCEHGNFEPHDLRDGRYRIGTCPGGPEPSNDDLIAELQRRGVVGFVEWMSQE